MIRQKHLRVLAYYLPQYHPIKENDQWWGKGFTEWTNVAKAKPLFKGHYQPNLPTDLGYYDLRVQETQIEQANLANEYGIEGFIYYHYWFGNGQTLLERPLKQILDSKEPDFPFCICWANETWRGIWFGNTSSETLIEQSYPGQDDCVEHFKYLLPYFKDSRYIRIDGKLVFNIYKPLEIPNLEVYIKTFRQLASDSGLGELYILASRCPSDWKPVEHGFDGVIGSEFSTMRYYTAPYYESKNFFEKLKLRVRNKIFGHPNTDVEIRKKPIVVEYEKAIQYLLPTKRYNFDYFPCAIPNWDNTPRSGVKGLVFHNSTPTLWKDHLNAALEYVSDYPDEKKIVIIKSWNEWAEGNFLEPDARFGRKYLEVIRSIVFK